MADADDADHQHAVVDGVDDAVIPHADTPAFAAGKFANTLSARLVRKRVDRPGHAPLMLPGQNCNRLAGAGLDLNAIAQRLKPKLLLHIFPDFA